MARTAEAKRDRMHLRLDARTKREKITLSARDWEPFYDTLLKPPKPNRKLREAARRYRERVSGGAVWCAAREIGGDGLT